MRKALFGLTIVVLALALGCETGILDSAMKPKYQPTDGRNLSPDMPQQFQQDPQWPDDVNRGGGGGNKP
jgi:hypothetical protein